MFRFNYLLRQFHQLPTVLTLNYLLKQFHQGIFTVEFQKILVVFILNYLLRLQGISPSSNCVFNYLLKQFHQVRTVLHLIIYYK